MASCLKIQTVNGTPFVVPDEATPVSSCTLIAVNGSEYAQLASGYINSVEDAEAIASAFILLFAVVWGFRKIAEVLNAGDSVSDEKH